jgi:hypothetical protein
MVFIVFLCGLLYGYLLCNAVRVDRSRAKIERTLGEMSAFGDLPGYMHPDNWPTPCTCSTEGDNCRALFHSTTDGVGL